MIAAALDRALLRLLAVPRCTVVAGAPRAAIARDAIGIVVAVFAVSAFADVPRPTVEIGQPGTKCVAPPAEMRRNHMEMLKHQRDRTLRLGERGARVSLNACIDCHASRKTGSVIAAKDDFCESCHSYAAVKLDCFECHQGKSAAKAAKVSELRR